MRRIRTVLSLSTATLLGFAAPAFAYDPQGSAKPCAQCHKLPAAEASQLLKGVVEKVLGVAESEIKGLWVVDVESRGRKGSVYVDYSKKYLVGGSIIRLAGMENLTQQRGIELNKIDFGKIPLGDAIVVGKPEARLKVVVFDDPECPYCQKLQAEMHSVVQKRPDVAFYIKMYPLASHPKAKEKAKTIVCEKSLKLLEDSLAGKEIPAPTCETNQIEENIRLAQELGVNSTPTLIFPDGKVVPGYRPADKIIELLPQSSPSHK
jgi:thiol:disulfide interchange protein DsbC